MNKAPKAPIQISHQDALTILATRIQKLEITLHNTIKMFEKKIGNHESYVADNIPDCEQYLTLFSDINKRLLDLESLDERISHLENTVSASSAVSDELAERDHVAHSPAPMPPPSPAKVVISKNPKKKSTVKLTELTDNSPGISFT
jgi:hypothetical protein